MLFDHDSAEAQAHAQVTGGGHTAKLSHELIAAAASYEAAKAYENHVTAHGQPANHKMAVELLAAFSGAFIDRYVETRGAEAWEKRDVIKSVRDRASSVLTAKPGAY